MTKTSRLLAALVASAGLAACSNGNGAVPPPSTTVNPGSPAYSHLQFAVGTANIAGQPALNTVVTLRQPNGLSAVGYSTPKITWDGAFVNTGGSDAGGDAGLAQISGVLPVNPAGSAKAPASTFGSGTGSWGAFGNGFNPSNSGTSGGPTTIQQPCLPFYGGNVTAPGLAAGTANCGPGQTQFFGGPPAFPNVRTAPLVGQLGAFLGFTPFALTPAPNAATGKSTFTLNVALPTSPVTNLAPVTAALTSFAPLGTFATPAFVSDGTGGGTVTYTLPAGVTEAYIQIIDWGPDNTFPVSASTGNPAPSPNCNYGGAPPFFYTLEVTAGGTNTVAIGDNLGAKPAVGTLPAGKSTHTFCTAADNSAAAAAGVPVTNAGASVGAGPSVSDFVQVIGIGFDYPAYEAATSTSATPAITGANGQADLSVSDSSGYLPT